jgi:uncharacterized protein
MALKIKIGNAVRGKEEFFERKEILKSLKDKVYSNSHILISAPRRVGKTSLMFYLKDNPYEHYTVIYVITQSVYNENDFFKILYEETAKEVYSKGKQKFKNAYKWLSDQMVKLNIKVAGNEFNLEKGNKNIVFLEEFKTLINQVKADTKLVIMVDEFAQTIENIKKQEGAKDAMRFLQVNRELRQLAVLDKNIIFVYAGSIGLENVVSGLDCINLINDLDNLSVEPLSMKQGKLFINELIENQYFNMSDSVIEYTLKKIKWLIPFYIQLVINEVIQLCSIDEIEEVTNKVINEAMEKILKYRNYFEHWHSRLKDAFTSEDKYNFALDILNKISIDNKINRNEIVDLALKYSFEKSYMDTINSLEYDGYISFYRNNYIFNSPILRMWWCRNVSR